MSRLPDILTPEITSASKRTTRRVFLSALTLAGAGLLLAPLPVAEAGKPKNTKNNLGNTYNRRQKEDKEKKRKPENRGGKKTDKKENRPEVCAQATTPAYNPATGEKRTFPTRCLPDGWMPLFRGR